MYPLINPLESPSLGGHPQTPGIRLRRIAPLDSNVVNVLIH